MNHRKGDRYRYTLTRDLTGWYWDDPQGQGIDATMCWVMLNPSTADDVLDDQTIRQVMSFTYKARYTRLIVVNLFAARATQPAELLTMDDPVGPDNHLVVERAMTDSARVVFAWGAWYSANDHKMGRAAPAVENLAGRMGHRPLCLGKTKNGSPKHPCRLPHATEFEAY